MALTAPSSEVDVCNLALMKVKEDLIASIDPPDEKSLAAQLCAQLYHQVRQSVLRSYLPNFAILRVQLLPDAANAPIFGYTHAYDLPPDFIRFIARYDTEGNSINSTFGPDDYEIEAGIASGNTRIVLDGADNTAINIRYVYDHVAISKWDPLFIELFAIRLAIRLAPNFKNNANTLQLLIDEQTKYEAKASAVDGQERPPRRRQRSKSVTSRLRGNRLSNKFLDFGG